MLTTHLYLNISALRRKSLHITENYYNTRNINLIIKALPIASYSLCLTLSLKMQNCRYAQTQMFPFCTPKDIYDHVHEEVVKLGSKEEADAESRDRPRCPF